MADNNYRAQVDQGTVSPQTSAIRLTDIFSRATPIPDAGKGAAELAQTFGAMKPVVAEAGKVWEQQKYDEGVQARLTGTLSDGTKIKDGELPFTGSQRFMEGYHVTDGKLLAQQVGQAVHADWDQSDVKNNPDPNAAAAFFNSKFQEKAAALGLDKANQFTRAGYAAAIPQHINNMYARQGEAVEQFIHQDTLNKVQTAADGFMRDIVTDTSLDGLSDLQMKSKVSDGLNAILANPTFKALKPKEQNKAIFNAFKGIADLSGDATVYNFMPTWVKNSEINEAFIQQARDHANSVAIDRLNREKARDGFEADKALKSIVMGQASDPLYIHSDDFQKSWGVILQKQPSMATQLSPIMDAARQGYYASTPSDESVAVANWQRAMETGGAGGKDALQVFKEAVGMRPGQVQRPENIAKLMGHAEKVNTSQPLMTSESYKAASGRLGLAFGLTNYDGITAKLDTLDPAIRPNFVQATTDLRRQARNWIKQQSDLNHRPPSDYEFDDWLDGKVDGLVTKYGPKAVAKGVEANPSTTPSAPASPSPSGGSKTDQFLRTLGE